MEALLKADFCRCCLLNTTDTENELINMSQTFSYQNKNISLYDGYFETTGCKKEFNEIPLSENRICQFCVNELENAYVFKKLCLEANQILKRKYEDAKASEPKIEAESQALGATDSPSKKKAAKRKTIDAEQEPVVVPEKVEIDEPVTPTSNRRTGKGRGKASPVVDASQPSTSADQESTAKITKKRKKVKESGDVDEEVASPRTPVRGRKGKSKDLVVATPSDEKLNDSDTLPAPNDSSDGTIESNQSPTPETNKKLIYSKIIEQIDGKFQCSVCQKITTSKPYMHRHIRCHFTDSPGEKRPSSQQQETPGQFPCAECERVFTCRSGLTKHFNKEHLNVRQTCEVCNKVFKSRSGLHSHTKSNHLNMRFECLICAQEFKAVNALKEHNRIQHENARFDCKLCGHQCRKVQDLWVHSFTHRGFMPFSCKICDYKTAVKSNYKNHLSKLHNLTWNEKLYGYTKETREQVLSYVRDKAPST